LFSKVSSVFTSDAEGPGDCESGVFIAEKADEVGDKGKRDTIIVDKAILLWTWE